MTEPSSDEEWAVLMREAQRTRNYDQLREAFQEWSDRGVAQLLVEFADPELIAAVTTDDRSGGFEGWIIASEIIHQYEPNAASLALLDSIRELDINESMVMTFDDLAGEPRTLLGLAALMNRPGYFRWLVQHGADPGLEFHEGLQLAPAARTMVELLRLGASPNVIGQEQSKLLQGPTAKWALLSLPVDILQGLHFVTATEVREGHVQLRAALEAALSRDLARYMWAAL